MSFSNRAVAANAVLTSAACAVLNALIFGLGWAGGSRPPSSPLLPPDWAIGSVWLALFASMGAARGMLAGATGPGPRAARRWLDALAVNCALYPFYTLGLSSERIGLAGNVLTVILATVAALSAAAVASPAWLLVAPVLAWAAFATMIALPW